MKSIRRSVRKALFGGAVALTFGLFATACSSDKKSESTTTSGAETTTTAVEAPTPGGTLNVGLESAISTLDPIAALAQPADKDVALAIYDPLVSLSLIHI